MTDLVSVMALKVLGRSLDQLFKTATGRFQAAGVRWRNENSRKRLASKVAAAQKVKTFWQRDKPVDLKTFYYPSKVIYGNAPPRQVDSIADLTIDENLVLQGTVGQGKSTLLRYLCIQELTSKGSGRIPVFVELRSITKEGLRPLLYSALDRLGFEIDDDLFEFYARSGRLVLLLDAFDEISAEAVAATIYTLEEFAEKYENFQIIVTSRPNSEIQQSRHFRVIRLAPMTPDEHEPFLNRIGFPRDDTARLLTAIRASSADVANLLTTPLIMTLLATLYQSDKVIPQDVPEFYERLFHTLFTRHDATKPGLVRRAKSQLSELRLRQLFEGFCFSVLQRGAIPLLTLGQFTKCVEAACKITRVEVDSAAFQHDITRIACLLQQEGDQLHFIHRSVLEFHAAAFIRSLSDTVAPQIYQQLAESREVHPWHQVLQFLSQIDRFRFAKYYGIPSINVFLRQVQIEPDSPDQYDVRRAASVLFNDGVLRLVRGPDGKVQAAQFGPMMTGAYSQYIAAKLINVLFTSIPRILENAESFGGKDLKELVIGGPGVEVPWSECIDDQVWVDISRIVVQEVKRLLALRREYEKCIDEDSKQFALISLDLGDLPKTRRSLVSSKARNPRL